MKKRKEPQRGESAWLAAKAEMNKRNSDARDRAQAKGEAQAARAAAQRRHIARMEMSDLPSQPTHDAER